MTLVPTAALVQRCTFGGAGVLAFNVMTLEHAEAVVAGAEQSRRSMILQVSHNVVRFHHDQVLPFAAALVQLAKASSSEVALHLDHVEDERLLRQAADAGFSSVMFDAGALAYAENVAATRRAAEWVHDAGLWIEAELGHVGGKASQVSSAHDAGVRTDPDQAAAFVAATGVDALAVAVGSAHAMRTRTADLDLDLIRRLRTAVPVPLVLHGSSGVPDRVITAAIEAGMTKINFGTITATAMTRSIREHLSTDPNATDPRHYLAPARDAVTETVARLLTLTPETGDR